ncbi:hypothetical protein SRB5_33070 [Streptomyces sp. RB5]|uniref:Uncharacterized protein n=1 Tax=Streptomyces smaragdinus TaxID=2585196 RepID=A0A7K0CK66_9ACTN|nr:hypothetical protein [Streptomyces smaragdinus]MQY13164.1 hypothetical protein [Streptomyces smaragdinus]
MARVRFGESSAGRALVLRWGGPVALAAGAVLCVIGWYGVSGESVAERQLPYLASSTIPGAALVVAGAVLLTRGEQGRVEELYALLTAAEDDPADAERPLPAAGGPYLAVPGGTLYHRADCPLVSGKADARPVNGDGGELTACPVCEPAP